jgi:hypothetical protein
MHTEVKNGIVYHCFVAIQKHDDVFKVYIDMVDDSRVDYLDAEDEQYFRFATARDAIEFALSKTSITESDLKPCKGQKIFDPSLG